jgi:glycosyltransferase involved in cell wall biosynthesis
LKLLILNTSDTQGGAAIATYRVHQGLKAIGVNSNLLVQSKKTNDITVNGAVTRWQSIFAFFRPYMDALWVRCYRVRNNVLFSPSWVPEKLISKIDKFNPDVIHLFWVAGGFLRIETLKNVKQPIVWTLHDMWPFTGGCHYDDECGRFQQSCGNCPVLHSEKEKDLSRRIWLRKNRSWEHVPIVVVATSHWLADKARSSSLFKKQRVEVIPNGINTDIYKPINKEMARYAYNLPKDKNLILFSAFSATTDKRKGHHLLEQALKKLSQTGLASTSELVIVGATKPETPPDLGMKIHYMGNMGDETSQVLLYSASDVLVAPSMQENLSNTVMESLSCGTPVVAFNIGGMPDMIDNQKNGYLADPFNSDDLADGIMWVIGNKERHNKLSQNARKTVEKRYSLKTVAEQYLALYQDILK